ncbi:hypothetical protein Pmani_009445 [Petrolisthes manimaculis]|uniref:Uncharacterized protein n=1 Tax=Petrolisthes manimaculis TaxID=1843537 RepID=A0AAE1Q4A6_9EUCA|nr:hypothetical protein Pmani_009445 [Petrolisthes manimaculis]
MSLIRKASTPRPPYRLLNLTTLTAYTPRPPHQLLNLRTLTISTSQHSLNLTTTHSLLNLTTLTDSSTSRHSQSLKPHDTQ